MYQRFLHVLLATLALGASSANADTTGQALTGAGTTLVDPTEQSDLNLVKVRGCGGVLLNESWVLTAHHCVWATNGSLDAAQPSTITITADWSTQAVQPTYIASLIRTQNLDLALLLLGGNSFGSRAPMPIFPGTLAPGTVVQAYGRGYYQLSLGGNQGLIDGKYRKGPLTISSVATDADGQPAAYVIADSPNVAVMTGGDSGGPSFVQYIDEVGKTRTAVTGIHTGCNATCVPGRPCPPVGTFMTGDWSWVTSSFGCQDTALTKVRVLLEQIVANEPQRPAPCCFPAALPPGREPIDRYIATSAGFFGSRTISWVKQKTTRFPFSVWQAVLGQDNGFAGGRPPYVDITGVGGYRFIGRTATGELHWYEHTGGPNSKHYTGPKLVGNGFREFKQIFGAGDGVLYAIAPDGELFWYKHLATRYGDGMACPRLRTRFSLGCPTIGVSEWIGPKKVGEGWQNFRLVTAAGKGIIYAVQQNGDLLWYRHKGYRDGTESWDDPVRVGIEWNKFDKIAAARDGVIFALTSAGELYWYHRPTWDQNPAPDSYKAWDRPVRVETGLTIATNLFALVEDTPTVN